MQESIVAVYWYIEAQENDKKAKKQEGCDD